MSSKISGVVLAGGQGRRMGGVDKGLQEFRGRPLAAWAIDRLRPQVDQILINANRNAEAYGAFGYPVVADRIEGFAGPLAGLHAALSEAVHELVLTVPCDSPLFPVDLAQRLLAAMQASGAEIVVASTDGRRQPVFCLCQTRLLPSLNRFLNEGGRKFGAWLDQHQAIEQAFPDAAAFANLNTEAELLGLAPLGKD